MTRIGQSDEYVLGDDGIYIPYVPEDVYQYDQYEFKQLTGIDITELIGEKIEEAHKLAEELILSGKLKHFNKTKAGYLWGKMLKAWNRVS